MTVSSYALDTGMELAFSQVHNRHSLVRIEPFQRVAPTPQPKFLSLLPDGKKGVSDR